MVTVLKLGGSVITDKDQPETADQGAIETAAAAIGEFLQADEQLVVVHGGGSFGHHHAARVGVSSTDGSRDVAGLLAIHRAMGDLTDIVLDTLHDHSVDALPVAPLSAAHRTADDTVEFPSSHIRTMLDEGFTPVINGDVVAHAGKGATVLSGDTIVVSLAQSLDADRVGLCSTVGGVLDDSGDVIAEIEAYDDVADVLGGSESTDVTGGMAAKVRQLLDLDVPASVFDLGSLAAFLDTGSAGTVVR
ncbi:MAG: isopentenyl phosphate kinase [Halovenus sp.]